MWTEAPRWSQENVVLVTLIINLPGSMLLEPLVDLFLHHFPLYSNMTRRAPSPSVPSFSKVGVQARILWVKHGHLLATFLQRNKSNLAGLLKGWKPGVGRQNSGSGRGPMGLADCLSWWNMKPICGTAIWKRDPTELLQALMITTTKADGCVLVLKCFSFFFFAVPPPLLLFPFYPILSGLLAPCLSWSSNLCLGPRGFPELWN